MMRGGGVLEGSILLVRHGETTSSRSGLFAGTTDDPLSETGLEQAARWADPLSRFGATIAFCSPMLRARQTAEAAGFEPHVLDALREWDLGELEGVNAASFRTSNPDWRLFRDGPPGAGGEDVDAVAARARDALAAVRAYVADGAPTVVFSHGQFIRVLTTVLLGLPLASAASLSLGPARAAHVIIREHARVSLAGWNITAAGPESLFDELT